MAGNSRTPSSPPMGSSAAATCRGCGSRWPGLLGLLLALRRVRVVARALTAPGMVNRLKLPHSFWVAGGGLPAHHGLGHLPALIAIAAVPLLWALPITPVSALVRARGHRGRPPPPLTAAAR